MKKKQVKRNCSPHYKRGKVKKTQMLGFKSLSNLKKGREGGRD